MERAGKSILAGLLRADPMRSNDCQWEEGKCPVAAEKTCLISRVVYSLKCTACGATYIGTTGLTLHARGLQHLEALINGDNGYPMTKHYGKDHPGVAVDKGSLVITPLTGHISDNSRRFTGEAVAIAKASREGKMLLNSKGEWSRVSIRRLTVTEE